MTLFCGLWSFRAREFRRREVGISTSEWTCKLPAMIRAFIPPAIYSDDSRDCNWYSCRGQSFCREEGFLVAALPRNDKSRRRRGGLQMQPCCLRYDSKFNNGVHVLKYSVRSKLAPVGGCTRRARPGGTSIRPGRDSANSSSAFHQ